MVNGWKVTAIIFIMLFIAETFFMIWLYQLGTESLEKENECSFNVCRDYNSYYFDSFNDLCSCYQDENIMKEEYIR